MTLFYKKYWQVQLIIISYTSEDDLSYLRRCSPVKTQVGMKVCYSVISIGLPSGSRTTLS